MKTFASIAVLSTVFAGLAVGVSSPSNAGAGDTAATRAPGAGIVQRAGGDALEYPDPYSTELLRDRIAVRTADAVRNGHLLRGTERELQRAQEKVRDAERRLHVATMNTRRAADLAQQARQRARSLSARVLSERRDAQENRFEAQARRARIAAQNAERKAQRLAAEAVRLQTQSMLARLDAAQAQQTAARAVQAARDAIRWRRMVANTYFTPEQQRALAEMSRQ